MLDPTGHEDRAWWLLSLKMELDKCTSDEIMELFSYYCHGCGSQDP